MKVSDAVNAEYGNEYYTYGVDFYDDCGIYRFYSYIDGSVKLMKIFYTLSEDGEVTLGKIVETHVVYEDLEDPEQTGTDFTSSNEFTTDSGDGDFELANTPTTDDTISTDGDVTAPELNVTTTSAEAATTAKVSAASENEIQQEDTSTASFTDSERAELEALKREKKVTLINSYELTDEVRDNLMNELDSLTYEELELKLLKIYKENVEAEENFSATPVPFAVPEPQKKTTAQDNLNSYIRRMLGR